MVDVPRVARVAVGPSGVLGLSWTDPQDFAVVVERDKGGRANTARVDLFNLGDASIAWLEQTDLALQILAGEHIAQQIFLGDIDPRGVSTALGVDRVTTIKAGDGRRRYRDATFVRSYPAAIASTVVLLDILTSMGLPVAYQDPLLIPVLYPAGVAWAGRGRAALDEVVDDMGGTWSIQDGAIEILANGSTVPDTAVLISTPTGMHGSPKRTDRGVEVTSTLLPTVRPGRIVSIASRIVNGFYRVSKVRHSIDSRGLVWESAITAELL